MRAEDRMAARLSKSYQPAESEKYMSAKQLELLFDNFKLMK